MTTSHSLPRSPNSSGASSRVTPKGALAAVAIAVAALATAVALTVTATFASAQSPPPPCNWQAARVALANTTHGRQLGSLVGPVTDPDDWVFSRFLCTDLAGDPAPDMIALMSPNPGRDPAYLFIFRPVADQWSLSYSSGTATSAAYIWGLFVQADSLIEQRPYFGSAGLCCAVGYHYWSLSWNNHGWSALELAGVPFRRQTPATARFRFRLRLRARA